MKNAYEFAELLLNQDSSIFRHLALHEEEELKKKLHYKLQRLMLDNPPPSDQDRGRGPLCETLISNILRCLFSGHKLVAVDLYLSCRETAYSPGVFDLALEEVKAQQLQLPEERRIIPSTLKYYKEVMKAYDMAICTNLQNSLKAYPAIGHFIESLNDTAVVFFNQELKNFASSFPEGSDDRKYLHTK